MFGSESLGQQNFHVLADQFRRLIAENIFDTPVRVYDAAIRIYDDTWIRGCIKELSREAVGNFHSFSPCGFDGPYTLAQPLADGVLRDWELLDHLDVVALRGADSVLGKDRQVIDNAGVYADVLNIANLNIPLGAQ